MKTREMGRRKFLRDTTLAQAGAQPESRDGAAGEAAKASNSPALGRREFIRDFAEEARRIRGVAPGLPISAARFEEIIAMCRDLDRQGRADALTPNDK